MDQTLKHLWVKHIWPVFIPSIAMGIFTCILAAISFGTGSSTRLIIFILAGSFTLVPILAGLIGYYLEWSNERYRQQENKHQN